MDLIAKFQRSWRLFTTSVRITFSQPKLLLFPVVSGVCTCVIILFFVMPVLLPLIIRDTGYHFYQAEHWTTLSNHYFHGSQSGPAPRVANLPFRLEGAILPLWWAGLYLVSMFLATFFNVAFYSEIIAALNGKPVSLTRGLGLATSRLQSILIWALFAGLVGLIIRKIEQQFSFLGRIVAGLIGTAWSVAAVFVIPVIIQEEPTVNPVKLLKQSALTLRKTWGEALIGYLGLSEGSSLVGWASVILLLVAGGLALLLQSVWFFVGAVILWLFGMVGLAYVTNVASQVYRCALYLYAAEGVVPEPYSPELMDMAWKVKKN